MKFQIDNYYEGEVGNKKLKEEFIFSYSFSPGLYDKLCKINLFVKKDMHFILHLFFYDMKIEKEMLKNLKEARIEHYQVSKLPYVLRTKLSEILKANFNLKDSYLNDKNTFGNLDMTSIGSAINHSNGRFSINLSPDILDKSKFTTESEIDFLKLIENIEKWLNELTESTIKLYEIE